MGEGEDSSKCERMRQHTAEKGTMGENTTFPPDMASSPVLGIDWEESVGLLRCGEVDEEETDR